MRSCDRWAASQSRSLPELSDASRTESRARAPSPLDARLGLLGPGRRRLHQCLTGAPGLRDLDPASMNVRAVRRGAPEARPSEQLSYGEPPSRGATADPRRGAAAAEEKLVPSLGPELSVARRPHAPGAASGAAQTSPRLGTALALSCRVADILVAAAKNVGHPRSPQFGDAAFPQLAQGVNLGIEGL